MFIITKNITIYYRIKYNFYYMLYSDPQHGNYYESNWYNRRI